MTLPNTSSVNYKIVHDNAFVYTEPHTTLAVGPYKTSVVVPAATNGYVVNLATIFPGLTSANTVILTVVDVTLAGNSSGFWLRADSGGAALSGFNIRPYSVLSAGVGTLPTLYVDNLSSTNALDLDIYVSGS